MLVSPLATKRYGISRTRLHGRAHAARQLLRQRPAAPRRLAHVRLQRARDHRKRCRGDDLRQRRLPQRALRLAFSHASIFRDGHLQ